MLIYSIPSGRNLWAWISSPTPGSSPPSATWKASKAQPGPRNTLNGWPPKSSNGKGQSLIGQLIAAGEFPIGVEMQAGSVERFKAEGAPIDWIALGGVTPINNVGISVTAAGTNTHAAVLYYDFLLSRTGMEIMKARNRIPTRPDVTVPYLKPYKLLPFDAQVVEHFDRYVAQFKDLLKPRS